MKDFKPGEKIEVLIEPSNDWIPTSIESVLFSQVTYDINGVTGFLFKSEFGTTWRMAE